MQECSRIRRIGSWSNLKTRVAVKKKGRGMRAPRFCLSAVSA